MPQRVTYRPRPYVSDTRTLGALIGLRGRSRADSARERGSISQQLWRNLGGMASSALRAWAQHKTNEPYRQQQQANLAKSGELLDLRIAGAKDDRANRTASAEADARFRRLLSQDAPMDTLSALDPERAMRIGSSREALAAAKRGNFAGMRDLVGRFALEVEGMSEEQRPAEWARRRDDLDQLGFDADDLKVFGEYSPERAQSLAQMAGQPDEMWSRLFGEDDDAPTVGSIEDSIARYAREQGLTPAQLSPPQYDEARRRHFAGQRAPEQPDGPPVITPPEERQRAQTAIGEFREMLKLSVGAVGQGRPPLLSPDAVRAKADALGLDYGVELERASRDAALDEFGYSRSERLSTTTEDPLGLGRRVNPEETAASRQRVQDRMGALRDGYAAAAPVAQPPRPGIPPVTASTDTVTQQFIAELPQTIQATPGGAAALLAQIRGDRDVQARLVDEGVDLDMLFEALRAAVQMDTNAASKISVGGAR